MNIGGTTYKRKYGIDFFPATISDIQIELMCWKKFKEPTFAAGNIVDPWESFFRAMRPLLSTDSFIVSRWTEETVHDWTTEDFIITYGCASSEKSNMAGLLTYVDWSVDPRETFAILGSTTKEALKDRTFESAVRYFKLLKKKGFPGKLNKTATSILLDDEVDDEATQKAGIKGLAVVEGTESETIGELRGRHLPYSRLVGDELSRMRLGFVNARTNLRIGASKGFKFYATSNFDDLNDVAGQFSVPIDGWSSVGPDVEFWRTRWGVVRRHDGRRSPAIIEPDGAKKYPHLINQEQYDKIVAEEGGNMDAPQVWIMVNAWPPPQGRELTVMSSAEAMAWKVRDPVIWETEFVRIASLDPAFGGDRAKLAIASVGMTSDNKTVIHGEAMYLVPVDASSKVPIVHQLSNFTRIKLAEHRVPINLLAVDDSGTQSVADVIELESGQTGVLRIQYSGRASDMPVSAFNDQLARERYGNRITELYYTIKEYAQYGQVKGMPEAVVDQITKRRLKSAHSPLLLEEKGKFKTNTGLGSPDDADAFVGLGAVARERLGLIPGSTRTTPAGPAGAPAFFSDDVVRQFDVDTLSKGRYNLG